jgi:glutamate carboxypeptidase
MISQITAGDFEGLVEPMLSLLKQLVEQESPSDDKATLDSLGRFVAERMRLMGAKVTRFQEESYGDHWLGTWGEGTGGILLLTHLDTVYPLGTLTTMPYRRDAEYIYGPGCLDMKASIAMALTVLELLFSESNPLANRVSLMCTSDEEIGSPSSRERIEQQAKDVDLVLCLEPALPDGSLKTWRTGVNAIVEIARQIPGVLDLANAADGTTINIGTIQGGSRSNVVPQCCSIEVDVRVQTKDEGERLIKAIHRLSPTLKDAELKIRGGWNRPPMERDQQMQATFMRAREIARQIPLDISEGGTGGGSDANFVAGLGVPVLDGLGVLGAGAHSPDEKIELHSIPHRCALLAALIRGW